METVWVELYLVVALSSTEEGEGEEEGEGQLPLEG